VNCALYSPRSGIRAVRPNPEVICRFTPSTPSKLIDPLTPTTRANPRSLRIAAATSGFQGQGLDARYLGFFGCFNQRLFYEAHEVLESLWLGQRQGPNAAFYQSLIQLAGAFVHLQKGRLGPAAALFRLADANLAGYAGLHDRLDIASVRSLIGEWLMKVKGAEKTAGPILAAEAPELHLTP